MFIVSGAGLTVAVSQGIQWGKTLRIAELLIILWRNTQSLGWGKYGKGMLNRHTDRTKNEIALTLNLSHDSGAALFHGGWLVAAVNEERLNRRKSTRAFPEKSILEVLRLAGAGKEDISKIILSSKITPNWLAFALPEKYQRETATPFPPSFLGVVVEQVLMQRTGLMHIEAALVKKSVKNILSSMSINKHIISYEHNLSHSYAAYSGAPFDNSLVISLDGMGDGLSGLASLGDNGILKRIDAMSGFQSPALIYAMTTELLGYVRCRHEGKLMGLAARGNPEKTAPLFDAIMSLKDQRFNVKWINSPRHPLCIKLMEHPPEDVAAGLQHVFEDIIVRYIKAQMEKHGRRKVAVAGGAFANVLLNQKILENAGAEELFVFPHMGDGGLMVGGGFAHYKSPPGSLDTVYLGSIFSEKDIRDALTAEGVSFAYFENIEAEIAKLLAAGKVVGRFAGKMEFGPRALGNRSILASARDPSINKWLNAKMKRTEFMPFAPSTLDEYADTYYFIPPGGRNAARYMTITVNCKNKSIVEQPACVHIDNTARPQLVRKEDNPSYHKIINSYRELTGIASILNTSFNIHEEPIVCSPRDAIKSYRQCGLDALAIEQFLVIRKAEII